MKMKLLTLAAGLIVFAAMTVPAQAGGRRYYNNHDNYGYQQQRYNQCYPAYRPVQYCPPPRYYYSRPSGVNVRINLPIPFLSFGGGRCD